MDCFYINLKDDKQRRISLANFAPPKKHAV